MSIFSAIKDAIFGHKTAEAPPRAATPATTAPPARPASTTAAGIPASPADARWEREVDVEMVLESMASKNPQQLNWRTSIVDLMKLLGMESSLDERKQLAEELGYPREGMNDSAKMNVWLHKAVLWEIAKNGGNVPKELLN